MAIGPGHRPSPKAPSINQVGQAPVCVYLCVHIVHSVGVFVQVFASVGVHMCLYIFARVVCVVYLCFVCHVQTFVCLACENICMCYSNVGVCLCVYCPYLHVYVCIICVYAVYM